MSCCLQYCSVTTTCHFILRWCVAPCKRYENAYSDHVVYGKSPYIPWNTIHPVPIGILYECFAHLLVKEVNLEHCFDIPRTTYWKRNCLGLVPNNDDKTWATIVSYHYCSEMEYFRKGCCPSIHRNCHRQILPTTKPLVAMTQAIWQNWGPICHLSCSRQDSPCSVMHVHFRNVLYKVYCKY